jgi:type I restriction enzyme, S subunit
MSKHQNHIPKGWLQLRLGDLGTVTGGGTPSRSVKKYYTGHIPWVTIKDLKENEFWISDAIEHITPEAIESSATNLIEPSSVIIATRVGLGKVAINRVPVAINQDLKAIRSKGKVLPEFLLYLVYKSTFDVLRYSVGTTVKGIRQEDLLNIPVVPPHS